MPGHSTIWFPLALLALLAGLTFWVDRAVQPPEPKRDGSSRHDPDYKVYNFNTVKSSASGDPRFALAAVEMRHFPDDDSTQLVRPRFTQYATNKPYTQIQGQRGLVSSNGENVYFMDNVKVVRSATRQKGELTVLTDYLHIMPDREMAVTDRAVSILQAPTTVIRGTGMEYNKKLGTLKLFQRVSVHYEKPGVAAQPLSAPPSLKPAAAAKQAPAKKTTSPKVKAQPKAKQSSKKSVKKSAGKSTQGQPTTGKTTTRIRRHYEKSSTQP